MSGGSPVAVPARRRAGGSFVAFFLVAAGGIGVGLFFPSLTILGLCAGVILAGICAVFVLYGALREPSD